jgi:hypothetical protein
MITLFPPKSFGAFIKRKLSFCWENLNQRTHLSTPHPKFGNKFKHLRECMQCNTFYNFTMSAHNFTFFTILQHSSFTLPQSKCLLLVSQSYFPRDQGFFAELWRFFDFMQTLLSIDFFDLFQGRLSFLLCVLTKILSSSVSNEKFVRMQLLSKLSQLRSLKFFLDFNLCPIKNARRCFRILKESFVLVYFCTQRQSYLTFIWKNAQWPKTAKMWPNAPFSEKYLGQLCI